MATFTLTVCKIKLNDIKAEDNVSFSDCAESPFNLITGKSGTTTVTYSSVAVIGTLVSLDVHKRIGTHNNIKVRLKLIKDKEATGTLNVTLLKKAFLRREVKLKVNNVEMQKYYVFGVNPLYQKDVYYVDLDIYSWDRLMDIRKYSKSYSNKKLSGILGGFKGGYNNAPDKFETSNMSTLVVGGTELKFSFLEQCDETEYNFILRTANKCGEFFYFENDTLNLGLKLKDVTATPITDHSSIEPLSCENYGEDELKTFADNFVDEKPLLCKPAYDNTDLTFGTKKTAPKDSADGWMELNPPKWSRYLSRTFQYENLASLFKDSITSESSALGFAETMSTIFNNNVSNTKDVYTPDEKFFSNVRKAECTVANNQYRIIFEGKQKDIKLGDLVKCKSIDEDGKFVVVDVHSICKYVPDNTNNRMEVTVVPVFKDKKNNEYCYPLPMDASQDYAVRPETGVVPKSDTRCDSPLRLRTATVTNREDPFRLNRVRVRYDDVDDKKSPSDEWISVLTPFASGDKGISCKLINGDKVLVLQNIECGGKVKSFVIGSYFDEVNKPPYGQRKFTTMIRSKNGQYIGFEENNNIGSLFSTFFPGLGFLMSIIPGFSSKFAINIGDNEENKRLAVGGIEISDNFGLFTIGASSTGRRVTISSPFGTVGIDAAMGITVSAPNGNVKIVGKNVDIVAGNNLTLKSGANIDSCVITPRKGYDLLSAGKSELKTLADTIPGLFDIPALRFVVELLFKPVAGTLKVHSGRYLMLEAGDNNASLPEGVRSRVIPEKKEKVAYNGLKAVPDKIMNNIMVPKINLWITQLRWYKSECLRTYTDASKKRASLLNGIMSGYKEKNSQAEAITVERANAIIDNWISNEAELNENDFNGMLEAKVNNNVNNNNNDNVNLDAPAPAPVAVAVPVAELNSLKESYKKQWNKADFGKNLFKRLNNQQPQNDNHMVEDIVEQAGGGLVLDQTEAFNIAKQIRKANVSDEDKLFKLTDEEAIKSALFVPDADVKKQLRIGVVKLVKLLFQVDSQYGQNDYGDDVKWNELVESIEPKEVDYITTALANYGLKMFENLIPIESFNSIVCWGKEAKGEILMSQNSGSTLSINGQAIKERKIDKFVTVQTAMRNATL